MDKMTNGVKASILLAIAVIAGIVVFMYGAKTGPAGYAPGNTSSTAENTATSTPTSTPSSTGGTTGTATKPKPAPAPKPSTITFVTPIPGETWTLTANNIIQWSREAGVTGQIELLDAATKNMAGVIIPQTGPHQTSYQWNTRDLLLSRTNPLKTTVVPGRYLIRISFDGNNLSPITSQPIIIQAAQ